MPAAPALSWCLGLVCGVCVHVHTCVFASVPLSVSVSEEVRPLAPVWGPDRQEFEPWLCSTLAGGPQVGLFPTSCPGPPCPHPALTCRPLCEAEVIRTFGPDTPEAWGSPSRGRSRGRVPRPHRACQEDNSASAQQGVLAECAGKGGGQGGGVGGAGAVICPDRNSPSAAFGPPTYTVLPGHLDLNDPPPQSHLTLLTQPPLKHTATLSPVTQPRLGRHTQLHGFTGQGPEQPHAPSQPTHKQGLTHTRSHRAHGQNCAGTHSFVGHRLNCRTLGALGHTAPAAS